MIKSIANIRRAMLERIERAVCVDRSATHGDAEDSFTMLAKVWSAKLGVGITPEQVTLMLVDLKVVRAWGNPDHADNWDDGAGYFVCGGQIVESRKDRQAVTATQQETMFTTPEQQEIMAATYGRMKTPPPPPRRK